LKELTHVLFAMGLLNLAILLFVQNPSQAWILTLCSPLLSIISVVPNKLDSLLGFGDFNSIPDRTITKYRYPLSHSPYTLGYFLPLLYIAEYLNIPIFEKLVVLTIISWMSHLALDALTDNGIPLGKSAVIQNHPMKHYHWIQTSRTHKLKLDYLKGVNPEKINRKFSRIGVFLLSVNIFDLLLNKRLNLLDLIQ